jgi:hypothetical protein
MEGDGVMVVHDRRLADPMMGGHGLGSLAPESALSEDGAFREGASA